MFNFNHDQNAANPNPNNYCGGYSLAAIATTMLGVFHNPINVYQTLRGIQLQNLQNNNPINRPHSRALAIARQPAGTDMLLPSTFLAAHYAQLNYELNMNQGTFVQQALFPNNINVNDIIAEESATIGQNNIHLVQGDLHQFLQNDLHTYWLVLVNNATHWVAIERDQYGGYCIYNPAGGINGNVTIANNQIMYNNVGHFPHDWSGIAISVA